MIQNRNCAAVGERLRCRARCLTLGDPVQVILDEGLAVPE